MIQISQSLASKTDECLEAHDCLVATSTELHGLSLILALSNTPHQVKLAQIRKEIARYEYHQQASLLFTPSSNIDDIEAAESCICRVKENLLHFEQCKAADAKEYFKKYLHCLASIVTLLEEKLSLALGEEEEEEEEQFYKYTRLLSLATHNLSEYLTCFNA